LARGGDFSGAINLAREAVHLSGETDALNLRANTVCDLAEVVTLVRQPREALEPLRQAVELYEQKGNLVMAERTQERLAELSS
jgi:hypothetical protein